MRVTDFDYYAREYFGLDKPEARELLLQFEESGGTIRGVDATDKDFWADLAHSDAFDTVIEEQEYEPEERWSLDPYFPDDEYLEPDIEWEMTAEGYLETT